MSAVEVTPREASVRDEQPYLHELVTVVAAPGLALSDADGQLTGAGATGVYLADRRVLSRLVVGVDGREPAKVGGQSLDTRTARFVGVVRHLGDPGPDPTVFVERARTISPRGLRETIRLVSRAREPLTCTVNLELDADLADIAEVKSGRPTATPPCRPELDGAGTVRWPIADGIAVIATLSPEPDETRTAPPSQVLAGWDVALPARGRWEATVEVTATAPGGPPAAAPPTRELWWAPAVSTGDHRLPALVERSVADLAGLLAADPVATDDHYLTAGAPWYLTLFGRDSLWAARMALPLGTDLAAGTLRTLARRQGTRTDPSTEEEPGKILHEVRIGPAGPERYYGTVDATPLWISLLHDAWRWGLADADVAELLPNLEAALGWLREATGDGFVRVRRQRRRAVQPGLEGLVRLHPVRRRPARRAADRAVRGPGVRVRRGDGGRRAAGRVRPARRGRLAGLGGRRCGTGSGRPSGSRTGSVAIPAIALDGDGRRVDSVTSNIGHLLGTGFLDQAETAAVVRRLAAPDMDSGFGLRTMSSRSAGFNPLSYHGGSVWSHDTAIALRGLAAAGTGDAARLAASLVRGLLAAAPAFDFRLPELYGGESAGGGRWPLAYPAACRPQAWSAGSGAGRAHRDRSG